MSWNVERLFEVPALAQVCEKLTAAQVDACFAWLQDHFSLPYGQIDWKKVPLAKTQSLNPVDRPKILRQLLSQGFALEQPCCAIWSDADDGVRLPLAAAIQYLDDLWYPTKEDLWLIPDDWGGVIEAHHEGHLGAVKLRQAAV